ncbi:MAG: hypothetical protein JRD68_08480 [Deltaproteobacteria bacterium]|nr:hypothetical protein [Deltaproteobacteria bacterium]
MAYSALDTMKKANTIYEMEELSLHRQLFYLAIWAVECIIVTAFVLKVLV